MPYTITSGVGLVSQHEKLGRTIAGNSLSSYIRLERDDFAYNKSSTKLYPEGYIARFVGEDAAAVPNSIFTCFRVARDAIDPAFLNVEFEGNLHGKWLRRFLSVGARAHGSLNIDDADLFALPVPMPPDPQSLAEQRKIAECLTSLDELIGAQAKKLEALRTYRRGLMQNLFPREGETTPRLRFPEFRGDSCATTNLGAVAREVTLRQRGTESVLPVMGVSKSEGVIPMQERLIASDIARYKIVRSNFFAYNPMRLNIGSIARWKGHSDVLVSPDYIVFRCDDSLEDGIEADYLDQYRQSTNWAGFVSEGGDGGVRVRIYFSDLAKLPLRLPSRAEQQKIAECLTSLDEVIGAQARKLEALRNHKQGLMQALFPTAAGEGHA